MLKKHLLAAAVSATLVAPAAIAQSVTVYGLIDAGVASSEINYDNTAVIKQRVMGGLHSANGTGTLSGSRLGFRGTEDLGGGLRVGFVYELGINYSNGQAATSTPASTDVTLGNAAGFANVRQGYLELAGGFGAIRIGTHNSLAKDTTESIDPNAGVTMTGAASIYQAGLFTTRPDSITYLSPRVNGFALQGQIDLGESTYGNSNGMNSTYRPKDNRGYSVSGDYSQGPLRVASSYEARYQNNLTATTTKIVNLPQNSVVLPPDDAVGKIDKISHLAVGATYNFGPATVGLMSTRLSIDDQEDSETGTLTSNHIGLTVPLSGPWSVRASYTRGSIKDNGRNTYDLSGMQAVVRYDLSKRTHAYFAAGRTNYEANTLKSGDVEVTQVGTGIRHSF